MTDVESKKQAIKYFDALKKKVGEPYDDFTLKDEDRQYMRERNFSQSAIYHLVQYSCENGLPVIEVHIQPYDTEDQVIAVVCHECAHHFLNIKKLRGASTHGNELLTDYTTIYTGFGALMQLGYAETNSSYNGRDIRSKHGYISSDDIAIARKLLKRYKDLPIKERWYTCPYCGALVRDSEECVCWMTDEEAVKKDSTQGEHKANNQLEDKITAQKRYIVVLSALCVLLLLCCIGLSCYFS